MPLLLLALSLAVSTDPTLPELVVTGDPLAPPPGERAFDVAVIDGARLDAVASGRVEDVLRDVAGFAQFRRSDSSSAQPTSQGATLRGLGGTASSRALLLLDGVPFADPFGGWLSFAAIDPARLGSVRVVRGGGSGVAGPGALAGTVELESANPGQLTPLWADAAGGSRGAVDTDGGLSGRVGGGFAFLAATFRRSDGFVPIVKADRGPVDQPAPYTQASLAGRAVFPVGPAAELQVSALLFTDHRTRGTPFTPNRTSGEDASVRLVTHGRWGVEALVYFQLRSFAAGFAAVDPARTAATPTLDQYAVPATGIGGRVEVRPPLPGAFDLRLGTDARDLSGETDERYQFVAGLPANRRRAGGETLTTGLFAEGGWRPAPDLSLTLAGRLDRWRIADGFTALTRLGDEAVLPGTQRYAPRTGVRPTARAGAAWLPGEGPLTIRGAAYLGWRLPTLNELFRPYRLGQDSYLANPLLAPERLRGVDGGIDFRPLPNLTLSATGFANRLADAIGNVTQYVSAAGARTFARSNLPALRSAGAELDARLVLGAWRGSFSYAYADARVIGRGATAALDGKRPAQVAAQQASATLAWNPSRLVASATLRWIGPQWEDDRNTQRLHGALTLDALLRLPVGRRLAVELRGENLGDRRVEAGISGAGVIERATPRTLWAGLRFGGR